MCGLVGVASSLVAGNEIKAFTDLLVMSSLRGMHSTGIGVISKETKNGKEWINFDIHKQVGDPFAFLDNKQTDRTLSIPGKKIIFGHTRHATRGTINKVNAHPFETDDVMGAHNGTIMSGIKDMHKFGTDSEAIYNSIQEIGAQDTIKDMRGAWALTWYDVRDNTLNFLRNKERPLCFCFNSGGTTVFWASEAGMLYTALARNNITIHKDGIQQFQEDTHYSVDIANGVTGEWVKTELKGAPERQASFYGNNGKGYHHGWEGVYGGKGKNDEDEKDKNNVINLPDKAKDDKSYNGVNKEDWTDKVKVPGKNERQLTKAHVSYLLGKGCAWCSDCNLTYQDKFYFYSDTEFVCDDCYNNKEIRPYIGLYDENDASGGYGSC